MNGVGMVFSQAIGAGLLPRLRLSKNPDTGKAGAAIDWFNGQDFANSPVTKTHTYVITLFTLPF